MGTSAQKNYDRWVRRRDAATRVENFLDAWSAMSGHDPEVIYGVGAFVDEDATRDLLVSDLRILVEAVIG